MYNFNSFNLDLSCHDMCLIVPGHLSLELLRPSVLTMAIDVDINTSDTSTPTHHQISGLITWACVRQLNNQVSSFLASYSSYLDNGNMCSILFLRNDR
jgi:hypothetical protein